LALGIELPEPVDGGHALVIGIAVILREIATATSCPRLTAPLSRGNSRRIFDEPGGIAHQRFQQGGLAGAVAAHESDLFSARDAGENADYFQAIVRFLDAANSSGWRPEARFMSNRM